MTHEVYKVFDLRECSRKELTDQQISSRIHLATDRMVELYEEMKELEEIIEGLHEEQARRAESTQD